MGEPIHPLRAAPVSGEQPREEGRCAVCMPLCLEPHEDKLRSESHVATPSLQTPDSAKSRTPRRPAELREKSLQQRPAPTRTAQTGSNHAKVSISAPRTAEH